jgi:hypothetical protein
VGWIIVLCVVAILCIAAAVYRARTSYRRGSHEPPELAGTWEARHQAGVEGQTEHGNPPGAATW